jgi:hypothetical protein
MSREAANKGHVRLGEHNIIPNYFQQNQAEALNLNLTVLDTLIQVLIALDTTLLHFAVVCWILILTSP